jgi:hypothetical protein
VVRNLHSLGVVQKRAWNLGLDKKCDVRRVFAGAKSILPKLTEAACVFALFAPQFAEQVASKAALLQQISGLIGGTPCQA